MLTVQDVRFRICKERFYIFDWKRSSMDAESFCNVVGYKSCRVQSVWPYGSRFVYIHIHVMMNNTFNYHLYY